MSNSLGSTSELARRLETVALDLPELSANLVLVPPMGRKRELRQIGGVSAGGTLSLKPGVFSFGPKRSGSGRLSDGCPDRSTFTLVVDKEMNVTISEVFASDVNHSTSTSPRSLLLDGQTPTQPVCLDHQVIDVGSAQFVVAIPRPRSVRSRPSRSSGDRSARSDRVESLAPWVRSCIPEMTVHGESEVDDKLSVDLANLGDSNEVEELVQARRKAHLLPDEIAHRAVVGSALLWDRSTSHPLFGTCAVGLGQIPVITEDANGGTSVGIQIVGTCGRRLLGTGHGVPLSVDFAAGPIAVVGPTSLRSSVMRQILLSLAVTASPSDVRLSQFPEGREFDFCRTLPHFASAEAQKTLMVIDEDANDSVLHATSPGLRPDWIVRGVDCVEKLPEAVGTVITVGGVDAMAIDVESREKTIEGLTPVGIARSLAQELSISLDHHGFGQSSSDVELGDLDD